MKTYFLGPEEVEAYSRDFLERLFNISKKYPNTWIAIGKSGEVLAQKILSLLDVDIRKTIQIIPVTFEKKRKTITFENPDDQKIITNSNTVLILDSSIHSGNTMLYIVRKAVELGAKQIITYSLILKNGSTFVPNFFGVLISDYDRAYFLLDKIPNNRIMPIGIVRRLEADDVNKLKACLNSGVPSIDRVHWADLWYETRTTNLQVYVYEENKEICGFISFDIKDKELFINIVARDITVNNRGIGGHLLRLAETIGRSTCCNKSILWAIEKQRDFYASKEYSLNDINTACIDCGEEKYYKMEKKLLYNLLEGWD